jgi:hypothetical protein
MAKNKKKPKSHLFPTLEKQPRQKEDPNQFMNSCPVWAFHLMDMQGEWGWDKVDLDDICKTILPKLKEFETQKWKEIISAGRQKGSKFLKVAELEQKAQKRLKDISLGDIDRLFSFRIMAQPRLWGLIDRNIFQLLWWDPNHSVYTVPKKHT